MGQLVTFTNLFPSRLQPHHGRFVLDRMRRVAAALGCSWQVVHPVPKVPRMLRHGIYATLANMPATEDVEGVLVHHVPYPHVPGFSLRQQAERMRTACLPVVRSLCGARPALIDAHYVYPDGVAALQIGKELDLPVVVTARGSDVNLLPERPVVLRQIREVAGDAQALLAVCDALRDQLVAVTGLPPERVITARNGVDLGMFRTGDRAAARRHLGLPLDCRLVLGVGSLIQRKGPRPATRLGSRGMRPLVFRGFWRRSNDRSPGQTRRPPRRRQIRGFCGADRPSAWPHPALVRFENKSLRWSAPTPHAEYWNCERSLPPVRRRDRSISFQGDPRSCRSTRRIDLPTRRTVA